MVSELASWSSESLPELLPESSPEEMRSTTTLLPALSLEESALTSMRVDHFFLRVEEKPYLSMVGVARVCQLSPYAHVRLPPGQRRISLFHGALRKTYRGGAWGRLLCFATRREWRTTLRKTDGDMTSSLQNLALELRAIPAMETRLRWRRGRQKPEKGIEGGVEHLLKRFGGANDMQIKNHALPMKRRGQIYSNEEQFAFPLLICNQILYHVFLRYL
jgi:hypothetical protein